MNWTLELVPVPVSDLDRAKEFYADKLGFNVDADTTHDDFHYTSPDGETTEYDEFRVVQLTPPGSGCSIGIGAPLDMTPGSLHGLQLVVSDIHAARAELVERGVAVSQVHVMGEDPGPGGDLDYIGFFFFEDPDGNRWAVQQISARE